MAITFLDDVDYSMIISKPTEKTQSEFSCAYVIAASEFIQQYLIQCAYCT